MYNLQLSNLLTILEYAADLDKSGVPVLITIPTAGDVLDMMITAPVTVVLSDENNGILRISVWEVNREMN